MCVLASGSTQPTAKGSLRCSTVPTGFFRTGLVDGIVSYQKQRLPSETGGRAEMVVPTPCRTDV